jgi:3-deoxy-manno-octulosonate cytidylyltransferase (CMP-KDO synthetase)
VRALVVIPARHASQRFPGKPLAALRGATGEARTLIRRTWDAASAVPGARVVVATDDARIREHAEGFGAEVVMTPDSCRNGTERCAAVLDALGAEWDAVVNVQGDAPLTPPWFVEALLARLAEGADVATPVLRASPEATATLRADRAEGRVGATTAVMREDGAALYFSKEVLPFGDGPVWHHVGVYAYAPAALRAYAGWPMGTLERAEGLEQLRFLERGAPVACVEVDARGRPFWEVNHPGDVPRMETILADLGEP